MKHLLLFICVLLVACSEPPVKIVKAINPLTQRVDFVKGYEEYKKGDTIWYDIDSHNQITNPKYDLGKQELMIVQ